MRRSVSLQMRSQDSLVPGARVLAGHGLDGVWTTELPHRDAVARAAQVAGHVEGISVGTGIAYAFTRHPVAAAVQAQEVQVMTGGRFRLGLGTGHRAHWGWYGIDFSHPATRFEEYVAVMRAALEWPRRLQHAGRFYQVDIPGFGDAAASGSLPPVEILGAGLGQAMLRSIARTCDGVLLHPLAATPPFFEAVALPALETGLGTSTRPFRRLYSCITVIDQDEQKARDRARRQLAFYLAQPGFAVATERSVWSQEVEALRERVSGNGFVGLAEAYPMVPEDLLDACTVAGTPDQVSDRLAALQARIAGYGIDEIILAPVYDGLDADEVMAMLDLVGSASKGSVEPDRVDHLRPRGTAHERI